MAYDTFIRPKQHLGIARKPSFAFALISMPQINASELAAASTLFHPQLYPSTPKFFSPARLRTGCAAAPSRHRCRLSLQQKCKPTHSVCSSCVPTQSCRQSHSGVLTAAECFLPGPSSRCAAACAQRCCICLLLLLKLSPSRSNAPLALQPCAHGPPTRPAVVSHRPVR